MSAASELRKQGKQDAKDTEEAQKQASVGGDGTQGANTSQMDKMVFNSDPHCGVWGNEDGFQVAMGHYTKFLGDHPVWGATAIEKQHPIVVDRSLPNFNQKAWWPGEKTTLYQYCNCTTKKESAQYGKQRVRRNHCVECGYWKDEKVNANEYFWDPVDDDKHGLPATGDVTVAHHDTRGFHYNPGHRHYNTLTKTQKQVGQSAELGGGGMISESYDANLETRRIDTQSPNGPASVRHVLRSQSATDRLALDRKAGLAAKGKSLGESQLRSEARNHERVFVEGMAVLFEWKEGEPMPYGERDEPSSFVEGPARERNESRMQIKQALMDQPHNVTDTLAYTGGNVLEELQSEQRAGAISKALKYYQMVQEGRKGVIEKVQEEEKAAIKKAKEKEDKVFDDLKRARKEKKLAEDLKKGVGGGGNKRARIMAKTTFYDKSLHSEKHLQMQKAKERKDTDKREGRGREEAATNYETSDGKKKRRKTKKNKKNDLTIMVTEYVEEPQTPERTKKKKKKKKKQPRSPREQTFISFDPKFAPAAALKPEDFLGSDDDSLSSLKGGQIINLRAQQEEYAQRTVQEEADKAEAQRESIEKEKEFGEAAGVMKEDVKKKAVESKFGKSKRNKTIGITIEKKEEAVVAAKEAKLKGPPILKFASPMKLTPLKLRNFLSPKSKKVKEKEATFEVEKAELEGEGAPSLVDLEAGEAVATILEAGGEEEEEEEEEGEPPPPNEIRGSLLFQFGALVYKGFCLFFYVLELPLLRMPMYPYNPYKKWKLKLIARRQMREITGASALEQAKGMDNKFKTSPVSYVVSFAKEFLFEKASRIYVFLFSIYMEITRIWLRTGRVYTIEDLEGGAYDGDNGLVVRCFAQTLKKGATPLNVDGRTPDGKTPLMCCFEGLLKADANEGERLRKQAEGKPAIVQGASKLFSFGAKMLGVAQDPISKYNKTMATLLGMGADIKVQQDVMSSDGQGLVHLAAAAGNIKRLAWLLAKGCNADLGALADRSTPLHYACTFGKAEAAMLLMTRGAAIDKRNKCGQTPLHLASRDGGTHMVRVMMLSGAKKDVWDDEGKTAFDYAVSNGKRATLEALLVFRAPVMSSKQSIDYLFQKMLADGEHAYKKDMSKSEKAWDNVEDATATVAKTGINLFKWGAGMVRKGVQIADNTIANDETEVQKAQRARMQRRSRMSRESRDGAGGGEGEQKDEVAEEENKREAARKSFMGAVSRVKNMSMFGKKSAEAPPIAKEDSLEDLSTQAKLEVEEEPEN